MILFNVYCKLSHETKEKNNEEKIKKKTTEHGKCQNAHSFRMRSTLKHQKYARRALIAEKEQYYFTILRNSGKIPESRSGSSPKSNHFVLGPKSR